MTDEAKRIIKDLRAHGMNNGASLGKHIGICDIAADMIEKLSADRDAWKRRCEAAEQDINHCCSTCQYHYVFFNGCIPDHDCTNPDGGCTNNHDRWNWRGPCEGKDGTT